MEMRATAGAQRTNSRTRRTGGVVTAEGLGISQSTRGRSFVSPLRPTAMPIATNSAEQQIGEKNEKAQEKSDVIVVDSSREPSLAIKRQKRVRTCDASEEPQDPVVGTTCADLLNQTLSTEAADLVATDLKQTLQPPLPPRITESVAAVESIAVEKKGSLLSQFSVPHPIGLPNLRGSCSMNAPLHCILQLDGFLDKCIAAAEKKKKKGAARAQPCPIVRLLESLRGERTAMSLTGMNAKKGRKRSEVDQVGFVKKQLQDLKKRTIDKQIEELGEALGRGCGDDSRQFLEFLLQGAIHGELNKHHDETPEYVEMASSVAGESDADAKARWTANAARFDESPIYDYFGGQTRQYSFCVRCGKNSSTFAPFLILPLGIPELGEAGGLETRSEELNASSLEKVIRFHYASRYQSDMRCVECKCDRRRNRFESVSHWPQCLVLALQKSHLQRQAAASGGIANAGRKKKGGKTPKMRQRSATGDADAIEESGAVQFPEILQVPSDEVQLATPKAAKKHQGLRVSSAPGPQYQLVGVVAHLSTMDVDFGGHFTSFVRKSVAVPVVDDNSSLGKRKARGKNNNKRKGKEGNHTCPPSTVLAPLMMHQWFQCDDDSISPVSVESVLSQIHTAYLLLYDKM